MSSMQQAFVDGRYVVERLLGAGGMAQVYLTHDEVLDRQVALKILREQYAEDEEFVERFRREARSAASLSYPNIVSIYDQGRSEDGEYYIAWSTCQEARSKSAYGGKVFSRRTRQSR
jgi:serine/threonine protein kinase